MAAPDKSIPSKQFNIVHYTVSGKKLYDTLTKAEMWKLLYSGMIRNHFLQKS